MKRFIHIAVLLSALALLTTAAPAQQSRVYREGRSWVEETTGTLAPARYLKLQAAFGDVQVQGDAESNIRYTIRKKVWAASEEDARRIFGAYHVRALRQGQTAVLIGECLVGRDCRRGYSVDFVVSVPQAMDKTFIKTMGGGVAVRNLGGFVDAHTMGGNITADRIGGGLSLHTMGGNIEVGSAEGDATLKTAGGNIRIGAVQGKVLANTLGGGIELGWAAKGAALETAGGGIKVKKCDGGLEASTAGGSLEIGDIAGPVTLRTAGGSIRLSSAQGQITAVTAAGGIQLSNVSGSVRAETSAGAIRAYFVKGEAFGESYLLTASGDILVQIPSDLGVTVRAAIQMASGHSISSDFPELKITSEPSDWGPRDIYGEGGLNGGGPVLRLRTVAGNIVIRRAGPR